MYEALRFAAYTASLERVGCYAALMPQREKKCHARL